MTQSAIAFWLTEEKPDKTRRRRSCLGCGDTQEYLVKEPTPSYVAWFKAHQACRPDKSFDADMPQEPGIPSEPGIPANDSAPLPECPQCGFVGVYLTPSGLCSDCEDGLADRSVDDPRITAFMERMNISRDEFFAMVDAGQVKLEQFEGKDV